MVDTPQGPFACTRNKHESNDDRTPHTGIGGAAGGCRRRRSFRHVLLSMQHHALSVFFSAGWKQRERLTPMSLFSGTKVEMVQDGEFVRHVHVTVFRNKNGNGPHLIVNARLRRAHEKEKYTSTTTTKQNVSLAPRALSQTGISTRHDQVACRKARERSRVVVEPGAVVIATR